MATVFDTARSGLRNFLPVYRVVQHFRQKKQDKQIAGEQSYYEEICKVKGIEIAEQPEVQVLKKFASRLNARGISWPPSTDRKFHILYASLPGNWERHNIIPELGRIADPSFFFLDEQGIDLGIDRNRIRQFVDNAFPEFVLRLHQSRHIDLIVTYFSGAEISGSTIERIKAFGIPVVAFHWDDRLSFRGRIVGEQWSGPAAVCRNYDLNLTNSPKSLVKYRAEGGLAMFWPEGANPNFFRPLNLDFKYDVTFCGQRYGQRPLLVEYLRKKGIRVDCFGRAWEHGYQSDEDLVKIFNQSRINLGFGFVNESTEQCLKGRDFEIPVSPTRSINWTSTVAILTACMN